MAVRFAERVTTAAGDVDVLLYGELQDQFDDDAIVEITAVIGLVNYLNRFADALGLA